MVKVEYYSEADAMYIWIRDAKHDNSQELAENVIIDLDKEGHIIGIEVLDASKILGKGLVSKIMNSERVTAT